MALADTNIYRVMFPRWQGQADWIEVAAALQIIYNIQEDPQYANAAIDMRANNINSMATWGNTPQGHNFWSLVHDKDINLRRAQERGMGLEEIERQMAEERDAFRRHLEAIRKKVEPDVSKYAAVYK